MFSLLSALPGLCGHLKRGNFFHCNPCSFGYNLNWWGPLWTTLLSLGVTEVTKKLIALTGRFSVVANLPLPGINCSLFMQWGFVEVHTRDLGWSYELDVIIAQTLRTLSLDKSPMNRLVTHNDNTQCWWVHQVNPTLLSIMTRVNWTYT